MVNVSSIFFAATPFIGTLGGSYILKKKVQNGKKLLAKKGVIVKSENWGKVREELKKTKH